MNKNHIALVGFHISFVGGILMIHSELISGNSNNAIDLAMLLGGLVITFSSFLVDPSSDVPPSQ
ncbi:hypothetical protein BBD46_04930 [Natrialba sp. SSL1]|nr:hypothetical protein BBD46_04930 [Natrialba sp. SSL1]